MAETLCNTEFFSNDSIKMRGAFNFDTCIKTLASIIKDKINCPSNEMCNIGHLNKMPNTLEKNQLTVVALSNRFVQLILYR